jgi:radical SAM protein with 4Fe4S-binding SPASM domain
VAGHTGVVRVIGDVPGAGTAWAASVTRRCSSCSSIHTCRSGCRKSRS